MSSERVMQEICTVTALGENALTSISYAKVALQMAETQNGCHKIGLADTTIYDAENTFDSVTNSALSRRKCSIFILNSNQSVYVGVFFCNITAFYARLQNKYAGINADTNALPYNMDEIYLSKMVMELTT